MASTTFVDNNTKITSSWLNDVNAVVFSVLGDTDSNRPQSNQDVIDNLFNNKAVDFTLNGDLSATGNLSISGTSSLTGDVTVTGNVTAAAPTADTHLSTKKYVDDAVSAGGGGGGSSISLDNMYVINFGVSAPLLRVLTVYKNTTDGLVTVNKESDTDVTFNFGFSTPATIGSVSYVWTDSTSLLFGGGRAVSYTKPVYEVALDQLNDATYDLRVVEPGSTTPILYADLVNTIYVTLVFYKMS